MGFLPPVFNDHKSAGHRLTCSLRQEFYTETPILSQHMKIRAANVTQKKQTSSKDSMVSEDGVTKQVALNHRSPSLAGGRLEVPNQAVSRATLTQSPREEHVIGSPSFLWLPATYGAPWLGVASVHSLPPSSHGLLLGASYVTSNTSLCRPQSLAIGLTLIQYDLIIT